MQVQLIDVAKIIVPEGRRVADPDWVIALGEDMRDNGQDTPIDVVEINGSFRLIAGLHRLGGMKHIGSTTIRANVREATEFATYAAIKLKEIAENFKRRPLSVLDRAFDIAQWREIYENAVGAVKPGKKAISRKLATNSNEDLKGLTAFELEVFADQFSGTFSDAARKAFKLSRDAIFRSLKIACIGQQSRERLSLHPIADNQSELLALAAEPMVRQIAIINLLVSEPPAAERVADAIAIIDRVPPVAPPEAWARVSDKFSKLPETAKRRFFEEHWDFVEAMLVERGQRKAA